MHFFLFLRWMIYDVMHSYVNKKMVVKERQNKWLVYVTSSGEFILDEISSKINTY